MPGVDVFNLKSIRVDYSIYRSLILLFLVAIIVFQNDKLPLKNAEAATISSTIQSVVSLNKQHKYETSINILLNALSKNPANESLVATFKQTFTLHLYSQISAGFKNIALDSHDTGAYLSIAKSYGLMGDQTKAMETLLDGTIDNPNSVNLWTAIAAMELQANREAEALSIFKEIIRIDLKNSNAHNNIAHILAQSTDPKIHNLRKALSYAEEANALEPDNPNFIDTLAGIKFQLGRKSEALSLINKAIGLNPYDVYFKKQLSKFESDTENTAIYQNAALVK
jgi:tetratricopeptide (TPR) repeat protein